MPMNPTLQISSADMPDDLARLRAFVTERGPAAVGRLERHLARPRYRPAFTRIADHDGYIVGYALIGHQRLRLGAATLEAGRIAAIELTTAEQDPSQFTALLGDCLRVLAEEGLPLALVCGPTATYAPFGFAPYGFLSQLQLASQSYAPAPALALRRATENDLDDLAALYDATYQALPLTAARSAPDWRFWLADDPQKLVAEDNRTRIAAYATIEPGPAGLTVAEAAAADAGAARVLCRALQSYAHTQRLELLLTLSPWHLVAQAALHLNGTARLAAHSERQGDDELAGVVDLPLLLEALAPEFERRLAHSRYAGWSGNLRLEIETERITLAFAEGRATVIDGSRPADLRLRQISLPALAELCLGYRVAADLRATGGLACDDSALGLLDALFPALLATGTGAEY
jgi:predicted acetyltransferase